jgi:hypothetical protein
MYIYVYIYIYIHYLYIYIYIYVYLYIYIYRCADWKRWEKKLADEMKAAGAYVYTYVLIDTLCTCIYLYMCIYINIYMHIYAYIYVYTYVYICVFSHTYFLNTYPFSHLYIGTSLGMGGAKAGEDIANALWVAANTKQCPRCSTAIEKDEGCNHMSCRKCRYEFCWICMQDWTLHSNNTGMAYIV